MARSSAKRGLPLIILHTFVFSLFRLAQAQDKRSVCTLNGLQELLVREVSSILSHFRNIQEYLEVSRSLVEQWLDSDLPASSEVNGMDDLSHLQVVPGVSEYVLESESCPPDKNDWRRCTNDGSCRCTQIWEREYELECGGADGEGGIWPDINCMYWANKETKEKTLEVFVPGWASNYSFNYEEMSAAKDSLHPYAVYMPHRARQYLGADLGADIDLTKPDEWEITKLCAKHFLDCPADTLAKPMTVKAWKSQGGIVVQTAECYKNSECKKTQIDGKKFCPRMCLDPGSYNNNILNFLLVVSAPLQNMMIDLAQRYYGHTTTVWYYHGNRGEFFVFPKFPWPSEIADNAGWDLMYDYIAAGPSMNPSRSTVWSQAWWDASFGVVVSTMTPIYLGDYWVGTVGTDVRLAETISIVESMRGTKNGHAILISGDGTVLAAAPDTYDKLFCPYAAHAMCTCSEEYEAIRRGESATCSPDSVKDRFVLTRSWAPPSTGMKIQNAVTYKGDLHTLANSIAWSDSGMQVEKLCLDAPEPIEGNSSADCTTSEYWVTWEKTAGTSSDDLPWKLILIVPRQEIDLTSAWSVDERTSFNTDFKTKLLTLSNTGARSVTWQIPETPGFLTFPQTGTLAPAQQVQLRIGVVKSVVEGLLGDNSELTLTIESMGESRACFANLVVTMVFRQLEESDEFLDSFSVRDLIITLCSVVAVALLIGICLCVRRMRKSKVSKESTRSTATRIQEQESLRTQQKLSDTLSSALSLGFPMSVISAAQFVKWAESGFAADRGMYESLRNDGKLVTLDDIQLIRDFKALGRTIIIFSYQWPSWDNSGPDEVQLESMKAAIEEVCRERDIPSESVYLWLDVISVPQHHLKSKELAVNSLYLYASQADMLVIICHHGTLEAGEKIEKQSYESRAWSRVEQMAYCCHHGLESMFIMTAEGLRDVSSEWITGSARVFDGDMRGCDKESFLPTMLAIHFNLYTRNRSGDMAEMHESFKMLWDCIRADKDKIYPSHYKFIRMEDNVEIAEKRELFGTMVQHLEKLVDQDVDASARLINSGSGNPRQDGKVRIAVPECAPREKRLTVPGPVGSDGIFIHIGGFTSC